MILGVAVRLQQQIWPRFAVHNELLNKRKDQFAKLFSLNAIVPEIVQVDDQLLQKLVEIRLAESSTIQESFCSHSAVQVVHFDYQRIERYVLKLNTICENG